MMVMMMMMTVVEVQGGLALMVRLAYSLLVGQPGLPHRPPGLPSQLRWWHIAEEHSQ